MAKPEPEDVSIVKFDILASYTHAKALHDGLSIGRAGMTGRPWPYPPQSRNRADHELRPG